MRTSTDRWRPDLERVAAKVLDGEAILIHLAQGTYYSMSNVGGLIWELIERGSSLQEITDQVCARYQVEPERARADLERLLDQLESEGLLVATQVESAAGPSPAAPARLPYDPPTLHVYRDMADLLALDPPTAGLENLVWSKSTETG
jgi:hypothetical protein